MKKRKLSSSSKSNKITPLDAVEFLESFRKMMADKDEATQLISLRVPGNLLRLLKTKAKMDGKKYQTLIVQYIRKGLKEDL